MAMVPTSRTIKDFLDLVRVGSPLTERTYRTGLRYFQEYLRHIGLGVGIPVDKVATTRIVSSFLPWLQQRLEKEARRRGQQDANPSTLRTYLVAVIRWYEYCLVHGEWLSITVDDFERMRRALYERVRVEPRVLEHRLPGDEVLERVLALVRGPMPAKQPAGRPSTEAQQRRRRLAWLRNRAIVEVLLTSGMRVRELCSLRRRDLLDDRRIEVQGKGKRHRVVFLSRRAWEALWEYLRERDGEGKGEPAAPLFAQHGPKAGRRILPLGTRAVQRIFRDIARDAGISFHLTPHTLRHAFATRMLEATGNLALVQDMLGHASPVTTRIYARVREEEMREAHRRVFDGDTGGDSD